MYDPAMLAAFASSIDPKDPLSGLSVAGRPEPEPREGWEIVEVRAASVNQHDLFALRGVSLSPDRLPMILGSDAAGVTSDGREVIVHSIIPHPGGESMLSEIHPGTFASKVLVPAQNLIPKPPELSFAEAATLPTAYLTAYHMLFVAGRLRPGERVLVQGAGGGVATAAIIMASAAGAEVTVTSRDPDRLARARELGAHVVLASGDRVPNRVDVVIETVGSATWGHSLRSAVERGRIVVAGATSGPNADADLGRVFIRRLEILGSSMGTRDELEDLVRFLLVSGARPVIDSERPLTDAAEALSAMLEGTVFGKLILVP